MNYVEVKAETGRVVPKTPLSQAKFSETEYEAVLMTGWIENLLASGDLVQREKVALAKPAPVAAEGEDSKSKKSK